MQDLSHGGSVGVSVDITVATVHTNTYRVSPSPTVHTNTYRVSPSPPAAATLRRAHYVVTTSHR